MPAIFPKNNSSVVKDFRPSNFAFSRLSRLLTVFLIIALLLPVILIVEHTKVKAEKQKEEKATAFPQSAPPLPFTVSKSPSAFSGLAIFLSNSFSAVSEFVMHRTSPKVWDWQKPSVRLRCFYLQSEILSFRFSGSFQTIRLQT